MIGPWWESVFSNPSQSIIYNLGTLCMDNAVFPWCMLDAHGDDVWYVLTSPAFLYYIHS